MPKQQRGRDFPATHFQRGPSSSHAISHYMGRVDQALVDLGAQLCCEEEECPLELKQSCFEQALSQSNHLTVS